MTRASRCELPLTRREVEATMLGYSVRIKVWCLIVDECKFELWYCVVTLQLCSYANE